MAIQNYTMLLYRRAVHPEFFGIEGRRRLTHAGVEAEAWAFRGGHAVRFQSPDGLTLCEVVSDAPHTLPEGGLVTTLPCVGERDHEETLSDVVQFMTTIQSESLSEHLYLGTYKEMVQHGRDNESLVVEWQGTTGKPNLSVIDLQRYKNELHLQGYHLRAEGGLVLRTQSMFRSAVEKPARPARQG